MNKTTIQNFTRVGTTDSSNDNLAMQQDSKVYINVTMLSSLGYVRSMRSDGVIVQVDPLIPGLVYDGPIPGYDFDSQASLTSIMANWNSFGGAVYQIALIGRDDCNLLDCNQLTNYTNFTTISNVNNHTF